MMVQKPSMVSIRSQDEPLALEALGSTQIPTTITHSSQHSAFGNIILEGVQTPALLETGSKINPMTEAMRDHLQHQLPPLQKHRQLSQTQEVVASEILVTFPKLTETLPQTTGAVPQSTDTTPQLTGTLPQFTIEIPRPAEMELDMAETIQQEIGLNSDSMSRSPLEKTGPKRSPSPFT